MNARMSASRTLPSRGSILAIASGVLVAAMLAAGLAGASERATRSVQGKVSLLKAELGGAAVVPGPGDPDGTADAKLSARPGEHKLCVRMEYELGVGRATAIHVHEAGQGETGPAVATVYDEEVGGAPGPSLIIACEGKMPKPVVKRVARNPRSHYIDFHTLDFPDGAIRGQLHE
jgi:CHRD domain